MNATSSNWPAGYSIRPRGIGPGAELIAAFQGVPAAWVSDCLGRMVGGLGLKPYHRKGMMCGPAFTVRVRPGDNLMIHKAIELAEPGDIIVVDAAGDLTQAVAGGLMREAMIQKRLGGFVVNGAIRDVAEWREGDFPVFALGQVHRGPSKDGPGEINVPLSCAGLAISPGDLVIGDDDGVVAAECAALVHLLPLVRAVGAKESKLREQIIAGTVPSNRFDALLRAKGCPL